MGTNTIPPTIASGSIVSSSDRNNTAAALLGHHVPRGPSDGAPLTDAFDLGTPSLAWRTAYLNQLNVGGSLIDVSEFQRGMNYVKSGTTLTGSEQPAWLQAAGASSLSILSATGPAGVSPQPLTYTIGGVGYTLNSNINLTSGFQNAPSSGQNCSINNTAYSGQEWTRQEETIAIASAGSEITNRIGTWCAFSLTDGTTTSYLYGFLNSATEITNARQWFFSGSLQAIKVLPLTHNMTLTLCALGWVLLDADGATVEVVYKQPVWASAAPSGPSTGQYWYDSVLETWKRWSGSAWVAQSRVLVGQAVSNSTGLIATRPEDVRLSGDGFLNVKAFEVESPTLIKTLAGYAACDVYGRTMYLPGLPVDFNSATSTWPGETLAVNASAYLYMGPQGQPRISNTSPIYMSNRRGWYHPHDTYRCIGLAYRDGTGFVAAALAEDARQTVIYAQNSFWWLRPLHRRVMRITIISGGNNTGAAGFYGFGQICSLNVTYNAPALYANPAVGMHVLVNGVSPSQTTGTRARPGGYSGADDNNFGSLAETANNINDADQYGNSNSAGGVVGKRRVSHLKEQAVQVTLYKVATDGTGGCLAIEFFGETQ
jgi:hypothetical protein